MPFVEKGGVAARAVGNVEAIALDAKIIRIPRRKVLGNTTQ